MNFKNLLTIIIILFTATAGLTQIASLRKKPISKVEIKGNRHFSESELKKILYTRENKWYTIFSTKRYSESDVSYDINQIKRHYGRNGFPFTQVVYKSELAGDDSSTVAVAFTVNEGKRVYVKSLEISGGIAEINTGMQDYFRKIKTGEALNTELVKATVYRIRNHYADNAYPVAVVIHNFSYSNDSTRATIEFDIDPGPYVLNGDVEIIREGSGRARDFVYTRELLIDKYQPYDRRKLIESQQRLYSTGLLRFVTLRRSLGLREASGDTSLTDFRLVVNERKSYFLNLTTGVGADKDFKTVYNTSVGFGNRNLWGSGRKLILTLSNSIQLIRSGDDFGSGIKFKELGSKDFWSDLRFKAVKNSIKLDYIEPWFLNQRLPLTLSTIFEPRNKNPLKDYHYDRLSGEVSLAKELTRYTNIRLTAHVEFVDFRDVEEEEEEELRKESENAVRRRLSLYGQKDTRDNLLAPQAGSFSYGSLDFVGSVLGGDFSYVKGEFYWSRFQNISGENVLASRINVGLLHELEDNGSSSDDRFTLGGAKSVRGFTENDMGSKWGLLDGVDTTEALYGQPKGGKLMILGNLEIRRPLFWRFAGTAFLDAGNVFYNVKEFKINRIELVGGLGAQFFTPIGPIRLDHGVRLKKEFDLADGATHLTILYAF